MFRRFGTLLAALALFTVAGGHWLVLQSVAWGQMLRDYSRGGSLTTAVEKTFSGKYPCALCRQISEAQKTEQKTPQISAEKKMPEFLAVARAVLPPPPAAPLAYSSRGEHGPRPPDVEPDVPVPIFA